MERKDVIKALNSGDCLAAFEAGLSEGINIAVKQIIEFGGMDDCKTLTDVTRKVMQMTMEIQDA